MTYCGVLWSEPPTREEGSEEQENPFPLGGCSAVGPPLGPQHDQRQEMLQTENPRTEVARSLSRPSSCCGLCLWGRRWGTILPSSQSSAHLSFQPLLCVNPLHSHRGHCWFRGHPPLDSSSQLWPGYCSLLSTRHHPSSKTWAQPWGDACGPRGARLTLPPVFGSAIAAFLTFSSKE